MKIRHLLRLIVTVFFTHNVHAQSVQQLYEKENYPKIVEQEEHIYQNNSLHELILLSLAHSKLFNQNKLLQTAKAAQQKQGEEAEIVYHLLKSYYYQHMLFIDSCVFHAKEALQKLEKSESKDSLIRSRTYWQYANAMRNGREDTPVVHQATKSAEHYKKRNEFLITYIDRAIELTDSKTHVRDYLQTKGTLVSDATSMYFKNNDEGYIPFAEESIKYLNQALKLTTNPIDSSRIYSLMGLNYFYIKKLEKAEKKLVKALEIAGRIIEITDYPFLGTSGWLGKTYQENYYLTKDTKYLHKAKESYIKGLEVWDKQYVFKKFNDAYHNSSVKRLIQISLDLFEATHDSTYLEETFNYIERSIYPELYKENISIRRIQSKLAPNQALVSYASLTLPHTSIVFIITAKEIKYFKHPLDNNGYTSIRLKINSLYDFTNKEEFKKQSHNFYKILFKDADDFLSKQNINEVYIRHSDRYPNLNFSILLASEKGNKWSEMDYLFNRYSFSYLLSCSSLFAEHKQTDNPTIGITLGKYETQANLRFSKQLKNDLLLNYKAQKENIYDNLHRHKISLLLSHGVGSESHTTAVVQLNSEQEITALEIEKMKLDNELVIFSACNTNSSQSYFSKGAIGSFNKALITAGSQAVVTTSWAIDDKSNKLIINEFINNLSKGLSKKEALKLAQLNYLENCINDDEASPLFWAPYILTGDIRSIALQQATKNSRNTQVLGIIISLIVLTGATFLIRKKRL